MEKNNSFLFDAPGLNQSYFSDQRYNKQAPNQWKVNYWVETGKETNSYKTVLY